jgi:cytochrome c5
MIIFGIALAFFCYVFVTHHLDAPAKVQRDRNRQLGGGSGVAERIQPVGQLNVVAVAQIKQAPTQTAAAAPTPMSGKQVYESTCVACHGAGIAGAPKFGNAGAWAQHISKGINTLYTSAIKGFQGSAGTMPAKGGNAGLTDAEVKAAVDYMVANSK